jgi:hypothetical protein
MKSWLAARQSSLLAWVSTSLVLIVLSIPSLHKLDVLQNALFNIQLVDLQALYVVLFFGATIALMFEPALRRQLEDGKLTALILFLTVAAAMLLIRLHPPYQALRLLDYPFTLWLIFAHCALLSAIVIHTTITSARHGERLLRAAAWLAGGFVIALVVAYIVGVGRYINLDTPDEAWFASQAWHFAQTGALGSPLANHAYGLPDAVSPRLYQGMGYWIRAFGDSLISMRGYALAVASIGLGALALLFWRARELTPLGKIGGFAALLTFALVSRTSHSMRPDFGLIVYGACALIGLRLVLLNSADRRMSAIGAAVAGGSLWVGMESVPTGSLVFGMLLGVLFIIEALTRRAWRALGVYVVACALACVLYIAVHVTPDTQTSITAYQQYTNQYVDAGMLGVLSPFAAFEWLVRFSITISPLELLVMLIALALALIGRDRNDIRIALFVVAVVIVMPIIVNTAITYYVLLMPFLAYLIARACRLRPFAWVFAFALLPSMAGALLNDITHDVQQDLNARRLAEVDLLTWRIPEGARVLADEIFWFTLRDNRAIMNWYGMAWYARSIGMTRAEVIDTLEYDFIICSAITIARRCEQYDLADYGPPFEFVITEDTFYVYQRLDDAP